MQTISINFIVPEGWHELSDKQLRFVYQLIAENFDIEEIKTLALIKWSGTRVVGRQETGAYLLQKGKTLFEATPLTIAELLPHLAWLGATPTMPVRISKINRQNALPADFSEVPFETFIICDNLYQGYLQTQNDELICKNLFQQLSIVIAIFQHSHLMDGDLVQLHKSLALRHALLDENSIEVLHIRQTYKLVDCCIIAYVTFKVGIGFAPLLCRYTEHRNIQHIGFIGVDDTRLSRSNLRRNKVMLYRIGVYTVLIFDSSRFAVQPSIFCSSVLSR